MKRLNSYSLIPALIIFLMLLFMVSDVMADTKEITTSPDSCTYYLSADKTTLNANGEDSVLLEFKICDPGGTPVMYLGSNDLDCNVPMECGRVEFLSQYPVEDEPLYARYTAPKIQPSEQINGTIEIYVELRYETPHVNEKNGVFLNLVVGDYQPEDVSAKKTVTIRGFEITYPDGEKVIVGHDEKQILLLDEETINSIQLKPLPGDKHLFAINDVMVLGNTDIKINPTSDYPDLDIGSDDIGSILTLKPFTEGEMIISMAEQEKIDPFSPEIAGTLDIWYPWQPNQISFKTQKKVEAILFKRFKKFIIEEGAETVVIFAINTAIPGAAPLTTVYSDVDGVFDMIELFGPLTEKEFDELQNERRQSELPIGKKSQFYPRANDEAVMIFQFGNIELDLHGAATISSVNNTLDIKVLNGTVAVENLLTSDKKTIQSGQQLQIRSDLALNNATQFDPDTIEKWWNSEQTFAGYIADFSQSDPRWSEASFGSWSMNQGQYLAKGSGSNAPMYSIFEKSCDNFSLAVDVKKDAGDADDYVYGYGLFLRSDGSWKNNYEFNITKDGQFMFGKMIDGNFTKLLNYSSSKHFNTGYGSWNRLRATLIDSRIELFVNENKIASLTDNSLKTGQCGLFAIDSKSSKTADSVSFDNFILIKSSRRSSDEINNCVAANTNLNVEFPCINYQNISYSGTWEFRDKINKNNDAFYWKLDNASLKTTNSTESCENAEDNLNIPFSCVSVGEQRYGGKLIFDFDISAKLNGFYWYLDNKSLYLK